MVTLAHYITLSAILFSIGVTGVICRRNALVIFMSLELMLNAANLAFLAFARHHGGMEGQAIAFFVIALAAAEVCIALSLILLLYRQNQSINIEDARNLKG